MHLHNDFKFLLPLIGAILLSLSAWTLISITELQATVSSIQNELINGAMKVISGLDWIGQEIHYPEFTE